MGKNKRKITVTITNPEALEQASINFVKALFQVFVLGGLKLDTVQAEKIKAMLKNDVENYMLYPFTV